VSGTCVCQMPYKPTCTSVGCTWNETLLTSHLISHNFNATQVQENYAAIRNDIVNYYGAGVANIQDMISLTTTLIDLLLAYPNCSSRVKYYQAVVPGCENNALFTIVNYINGILFMQCNGPICNASNQHIQNRICICNDGFIMNNSTGQCECPMFQENVNGTCVCQSGFIRDPDTKRCVCPPNYQIMNGACTPLIPKPANCTCPENEYYDYVQKKCRCTGGYYRDASTGLCLIECIYCGEFEVYDATLEKCVCSPGYTRITPYGNCTMV
jgi:hypothetical protein